MREIIDTNFDLQKDARGRDPDIASPTLRKYHKILWSKPLPDGRMFELSANKSGAYLHHNSDAGEFTLASDGIGHSYKYHKRKKNITMQIPDQVEELYNAAGAIGAYTIFPKNRVDGKYTINQARGVERLIDDRFDLTLECIRRYYSDPKSPLYDTLLRYRDFFDLFGGFMGYVRFFLLDDLINEKQNVRFYLPFNDFKSPPGFSSTDEYLRYKNEVMNFIRHRNERINDYSKSLGR